MDKRKNNLASTKICRFCLTTTGSLTNMYIKRKENKTTSLGMKILSSISVECFPSDKLPMYICERCMHFMNIVYEFKNICREADKAITEHLHTGSALTEIKWPQLLTRHFNGTKKAQPAKDVEVVKIEGGTTVEVSQDISDSEGDGDNVYNVRVGDGSAEDASACFKVVSGAGKQSPAKSKKDEEEEMEEEESPTKTTNNSVESGSWACDECNNSYALQQLLELHKMMKHRPRSFICSVCDSKFITKYDLRTHMLRHTDEMPFTCMACDKRFKREIQLRRHEKLIHSELLKFDCSECPAMFMTKEDRIMHVERHRSNDRKFSCVYCDKKFLDQYSLKRHKDVIHTVKTYLACEYCPERFTSVAKLTRHVRTHAGEKAYPCKFCNKRFAKSHHCTRHVRVKHSDLVNSTEDYRCEECNATFSNQDDLIYHSAIHATQNLVCPLCQEKFPDVDAVTTHIKSHVNGSEHMCDFCELMFTTEEKLENHITNVHNDELMESDQINIEDGNLMKLQDEEDDEDNGIDVKEELDHMVVEIKKPDNFMINNANEGDDKTNNTNSEESEPESAIMEETPQMNIIGNQLPSMPTLIPAPAQLTKLDVPKEIQVLNEVRKREEIKRKVVQQINEPVAIGKKVEKPIGASDKSLRLLEKELQELQRTNKREDPAKTPAKPLESLRTRRPQVHTSTPKPSRPIEEKKSQVQAKTTPVEKKTALEKRGVKENKKPEETKETKINNNSVKEDKETKEDKDAKTKDDKETKAKEDKDAKAKEDKETKAKEDKDVKAKEDKETKAKESKAKEDKESKAKEDKEIKAKEDKETKAKEDKESKNNVNKGDNLEKNVVKNGAANKSGTEENVRRSSRASKVKDYAKMLQTGRPETTLPSDDETDDDDDEEYVESEKQSEVRPKRRVNQKQPAKAQPAKTPAKKRGRPRKDLSQTQEVPAKVKKNDAAVSNANNSQTEDKMETEDSTVENKSATNVSEENKEVTSEPSVNLDVSKQTVTEPKKPTTPVAITQSTLKKIPIKALPPGIKPLPLPTSRTIGSEISEMQIGKKVVKVQKIVMTKAEVEAMAKKGLLEMKDGTMVLKPGVKLSDPNALKSIVGEKQSPAKAAPTRCDLDA